MLDPKIASERLKEADDEIRRLRTERSDLIMLCADLIGIARAYTKVPQDLEDEFEKLSGKQ